MINYKNLLKSFRVELKLELSMRRIVWKHIKNLPHKFPDLKHQKRYNTMRLMFKVFNEMTVAELQTIVKRIKRKKEEGKSQKSLF